MLRPQDGIQVDKFYPPYDWQYNTMPLTVVGSPTITDGVVSGFSSSDYLQLPNINTLSTLEIKMKFKITTNSSSYMNIISSYYNWGLQGFQVKDDTLQAKLRYNYEGTTTTKIITQSYDFQENIDYYVKYVFENNEFYVAISTDDITYTYSSVENIPNGATLSLPNVSGIGQLSIGNTYQYSAFQGEIDNNNSYIVINGTKYLFQLPNQTLAPIDIRKGAENNTITLLYGENGTDYMLFGLLAQVSSGTYDVYIDDALVGSAITSNTQYDIDFSTINTSYGSATTPEALVLHKVVIKPTTSGESITSFSCRRTVGVTSTQTQGLLWCYLSLTNRITLSGTNTIISKCLSFEGKGNLIKVGFNATNFLRGFQSLLFLSMLDCSNDQNVNQMFYRCNEIKRIIITKGSVYNKSWTSFDGTFYECYKLEQVNMGSVENLGQRLTDTFRDNRNLKIIPIKDKPNVTVATSFITNAEKLKPTKLDFSENKNLTRIGVFGTSTYQMQGLRGLKVSNEAPFSAASPQIDVSYTGLDRDALVELFNSLPAFIPLTKVGSPTISNEVVSNFSSNNYMQYDNFDTTTKDFCFKFKFNATAVPNEFNCLMGVKSGGVLMVGIDSQGKMSMYLSTDEISFNICALTSNNYITLNVDQYCKFSRINGSQYKLELSDDDITYRTECVVDSTTDIKNGTAINICFGEGHSVNSWYFSGSIEIGSSNVILNGTKYQFRLPSGTETTAAKPTLKCVGATGNNLTVIGSPTIDENGVASGFDYDNYFSFGISLFGLNKNFENQIELKINSFSNTTIFGGKNAFKNAWSLSNGKIQFNYPITNGIDSSRPTVFTFSSVVIGKRYILNAKRTDNIIDFKVYEDGVFKEIGRYEIPEGYNYNSNLEGVFGIGASNNGSGDYLDGEVYLENTFCKVDRNYNIKGYLLDADKNIALNKGWQLTLS